MDGVPTNRDLAVILSRTVFDFENYHLFIVLYSKFPDFQVPTFLNFQISTGRGMGDGRTDGRMGAELDSSKTLCNPSLVVVNWNAADKCKVLGLPRTPASSTRFDAMQKKTSISIYSCFLIFRIHMSAQRCFNTNV